ncbi:nucleoside-diphosphate sugar epimerase, partial [Erysipelatoclostridium sp. An15]|uniref:nucleoside-diphosphate sugar epimerase/dehydratase n=1 Tax=Erysipelatoclostridium sp. An15 TaxID=1965566 RepID=UPI000B571C92
MPLGRRVSINFKRFLLGIVDVCCIIFSCFSALFLQFDGNLSSIYLEKIFVLIIPIVIIDILIFVIFKLYQSLWQFASVTELKNIIVACLIASLSNLLLSLVFNQYITTSFYFIHFLILIITVGGNRFCYRIIRLYTNKYNNQITKPVKDRVLIVGAGVAGEKVLREINNSNHIYKEVVCFIDDEPSKWKRQIHGVDIYGGRNKIIEAVEKYGVSEILVAMPSISKKELANILNICKETRCQIKRPPGIYQFINDDIHISDFKDVEVQDLLGRE